ncbi:hypothetical protein Acr_23g0017850 [Actinidia rufa]|uniref:Uncharacterized protein n=1 Tax=Actinidia rufa TaxID=165716 RepID=A0A7J0GRG7_9ERIC|nr:hypothetical protein Acr_23g0017850 [Actinidia rufa]
MTDEVNQSPESPMEGSPIPELAMKARSFYIAISETTSRECLCLHGFCLRVLLHHVSTKSECFSTRTPPPQENNTHQDPYDCGLLSRWYPPIQYLRDTLPKHSCPEISPEYPPVSTYIKVAPHH